MNSHKGSFSERNLQSLKDHQIPQLVETVKQELRSRQIAVSNELGHVIPSNGELGFSVIMPDITFCVSFRKNRLARLTVTEYSENAIETLGITLDGPKGGSKAEYWGINEFKKRVDSQTLISMLTSYRSLMLEGK